MPYLIICVMFASDCGSKRIGNIELMEERRRKA